MTDISLLDALKTMTTADVLQCSAIPAMLLFCVAGGWYTENLRTRSRRRQASRRYNRIDSANYAPIPHIHVIDFDRSLLAPRLDGSLRAQCCLQGCDAIVDIGHNVITLAVEHEVSQ